MKMWLNFFYKIYMKSIYFLFLECDFLKGIVYILNKVTPFKKPNHSSNPNIL